MTSPTTHKSIAILNLPRPAAILISAKAIVIAMTGNAAFPIPQPALAAISAAIADLETAQAAVQARVRGAVATRDQKRATLVKLLEQLRGYVQTVADGDPEHAAALVQSAAMAVKKVTLRARRVFAVHQGAASGTVVLETASAGRRASYEWQLSSDGGKTWQVLPVTLKSSTTATGLVAGTAYVFRTRTVTTAGEGDWSQPISRIVL